MKPLEHYVAIAQRVSFRGGLSLWQPELRVEPLDVDGEPGLRLHVAFHFPDTRTGTPGRLGFFSKGFTLERLEMSRIPFVDRIINMMTDAATHEALEGVALDGELVTDPHQWRDNPPATMGSADR